MKKRLSPREKKFFILTVLALGVFILYAYIAIPLQNSQARNQRTISKIQSDLAKTQHLIEQGKSWEKLYGALEGQMRQKLSDEAETGLLLSQIEEEADKLNIQFVDQKPQKPKRVDFYKSFSVNLSFDAELAQVMQFLYILQNHPYYLRVDELRLDQRAIHSGSLLNCYMVLTRLLIQ